MKRSKPTDSGTNNSPRAPRKINSVRELRELQRVMSNALFRPLTPRWEMQKRWTDGSAMAEVASEFIKPNDRLSSFERLEIYNRQYWFRVLDCLYSDYPVLRVVIGERKFLKLARAYLARDPSDSYTLRNLGNCLEQFLQDESTLAAPNQELALEVCSSACACSACETVGDLKIMKCTRSFEKNRSNDQSSATRTFFSKRGSLLR